MDWTGKTNADLLAQWDAGAPVWSLKMTTANDAAELGLQSVAMEMLRQFEALVAADEFSFAVLDASTAEVRENLWAAVTMRVKFAAPVISEMNAREIEGDHIQAALQLAGRVARLGYDDAMESAPANRRIEISAPA